MMAEDWNDILRSKGIDAARAMFDASLKPFKMNGSAPKAEKEAAKIELPKGFTPESEMRPSVPAQLIKKTLPLRGTSLGIGQSGAGKSAIFIDMGISIASGTPFFEREVRHQGGVVYIAAEGAGGINNRISAAKLHRGIDQDIPLIVKKGACNLMDDGELNALIEELRQTSVWFLSKFGVPLRLTIIDTMSAACEIESENDNAEVAKVCKRLQRIDAETSAHALGVHHAGKNQEAGPRGASAWRANVDNVFFCAADRDDVTGECNNRRLSVTKYRDGPEGPISGYKFEFIELGLDEDGNPFDAPAVVMADCEKPKRLSASDQTFDNAFNEAAIQHGKEIRVRGDGPIAVSVNVQLVRDEFKKVYVTGEGDPARRAEAARKAFGRALKAATKPIGGRYGKEVNTAGEFVWKL